MSERRMDTYFLRFPIVTAFDDTPSSHRVRQDQLAWLEANGIGVEPTAPDGWLEGDAGIYTLDCDHDDPRMLAYADLYEDAEGRSLDPERYQMFIQMYVGERA